MPQAKNARLQDYEIIHQFTILHEGWECDNRAWIGKDKLGRLCLLMTDHGTLRDYGRRTSELGAALVAARNSLNGIRDAIRLLSTPNS